MTFKISTGGNSLRDRNILHPFITVLFYSMGTKHVPVLFYLPKHVSRKGLLRSRKIHKPTILLDTTSCIFFENATILRHHTNHCKSELCPRHRSQTDSVTSLLLHVGVPAMIHYCWSVMKLQAITHSSNPSEFVRGH